APTLLGIGANGQTLPAVYGIGTSIEELAAMVLALTPDGCQVVTDHDVTWNHCQDNDATIDGTLSWSSGHIDIDVHATATTASANVDYSFSGSMTVSDAALQADMTIAFTATSGGQTVTNTLHSQLDVQLATGCIYRGTLTVTLASSGNRDR